MQEKNNQSSIEVFLAVVGSGILFTLPLLDTLSYCKNTVLRALQIGLREEKTIFLA
jgi:hypothetical protein